MQCAPVPALAGPLGLEHAAAACKHGRQRDEQKQASKGHVDDVDGMVFNEPSVVLRGRMVNVSPQPAPCNTTFHSVSRWNTRSKLTFCSLRMKCERSTTKAIVTMILLRVTITCDATANDASCFHAAMLRPWQG